jgi:hypothetical protein
MLRTGGRRVLTKPSGVIGVLIVGLTGCGGPLSREDLLSKANAICASAEGQAAAVPEPSSTRDPAATSRYVSALIPIAQREFRELRALEPPADLRVRYGAYLAAGDRGVSLLKQLRAAAQARRAERARTLLMRLETLTNHADDQAKKLGLGDCAE